MLLKDIAQYEGILEIKGSENSRVDSLELDSRQVGSNSMFFAVKGSSTDAHIFIPQVIAAGASVVVCSELPNKLYESVTYVVVDDVQQSVAYFASAFYKHPSKKLKLIGVTGTNGKTSICTMLHHLMRSLGYKCGLISTVEYTVNDTVFNSTHTTPDPIRLNALLNEMLESECQFCFMEVSSHAIVQGRTNALDFDGGVFSNITHDHLDYHHTFDNYLKAKKQFFDNLSRDAFALTNKDDRNGMVMLQNSKATKYTYAVKSSADFVCRILESDFDGLLLKIDNQDTWFGLIGKFNAYNILAAYSTAFLLGIESSEILMHLSKQGRVNGRFEVYKSADGRIGIIDYAHTPDALENVLGSIHSIRSGNEQLITVAGCGGNRDKEKRPLMGNVAAMKSDKVIFTSDNPRNENPQTIIEEMLNGVRPNDYKKVLKIADRKEAIKTAVMMSKPKDIILIAGKGHETYQEIEGVRYPFDDREILTEFFKQQQ
ncbi:MAG: UDP-N-acetylmuramoyl-L-alanyl-D-glutamate--2,6-diaminopimelate ligase [Bacteroidia bacterium]